MRKREINGFTLIEILAVIILLSIISMIVVPEIMKSVQNAKKKSFTTGVSAMVRAVKADKDYVASTLEKVYTVKDGKITPSVQVEGDIQGDGAIVVNGDGEIAVQIATTDWCASKEYNDKTISVKDGKCTGESLVPTMKLGEFLIKKGVVTTGDGLYADAYGYRYRGTDPNNYIRFNNQLWRIVLTEKNSFTKIVTQDIVSGPPADCINTWGMPATHNTYFNTTYYNSVNAKDKEFIANGRWESSRMKYVEAVEALLNLRSYEGRDSWYGYVAMLSMSDIIAASSSSTNNSTFYDSAILTNNYLTQGPSYLTINQRFEMSGGYYSSGTSNAFMCGSSSYRPSVFLKTETYVTGSGTKTNPYAIYYK